MKGKRACFTDYLVHGLMIKPKMLREHSIREHKRKLVAEGFSCCHYLWSQPHYRLLFVSHCPLYYCFLRERQ